MRRLPPLHALRAFEAAARHLHFARAAEELHLTPTAISHQVRQLEEILQVKLFHRRPRPIRLTAEGAALFPALRDSFDRIAGAVEGIAGLDAQRPLTASVTVAFASLWLMRRLPDLREKTGLSLAVEADDRPADLSGGGVDFAVRYALQPGAEGRWFPLFEDRLIPVCTPDLLRRSRVEGPVEHPVGGPVKGDSDILRLPLIAYRWRSDAEASPNWERWSRAAGLGGDAPEAAQRFSEEITAMDAALAGQGAALASSVLVGAAIAEGRLVRLSDTALPGRWFWAAARADHPRIGDVERFAAWARASR